MSSPAAGRLSKVRLSGTPLFLSRVRARVGGDPRGGKTRRGCGDESINVLAQSGRVVLHGQQIMRSVLHDQLPGRLVLGVERVQGHGAPRQIQLAEEFARHGDLIGLGVDQRAAQVKLAGHGDGREEGVARAMAGFLAIDRDPFIGRGGARTWSWIASKTWLSRRASSPDKSRENVD